MSNKLVIFNLSVTLELKEQNIIDQLEQFLDKFYTVKQTAFGSQKTVEKKVYAGTLANKHIYQLHSNQFGHFHHYLKERSIPLMFTEKNDYRDYYTPQANMKVRSNWSLRDYQKPVYDFLLNKPYKSKLVPMQTGSGKTATFLITAETLKKRIGIVILSRFIDKWASDITTIHDAIPKDIMVVRGAKQLQAMISMAKANEFHLNYVIFSAETLQSYISNYESDPEGTIDYYGCSPLELFPLLGIGVMLNDETHMSFHLVYKILIYTNVEFQVGLSATLLSDDSVVTRMHNIVYPTNYVYKADSYNRYIDVYPVGYTIGEHFRKFVKVTPYGSTVYSHIAFEQSVTRKDFLRDKYIKIIYSTLKDYYLEHYLPQDKAIIFVATIKFATELTDYLSTVLENKTVKRYCEDDPYDNLMTADVIVTTVLSAGTGVDIPNLRVGIQTVSISSTPSNIQSLGRLRKLPDRDVKFCYLYAENIAKQKEYHMRRMDLFRDKVANIHMYKSRYNLI